MEDYVKPTATLGMPIARAMSHSNLTIVVVYLTSYVALDWISYVHPFARFGITPWNPQTGLSFALIILFGPKFLPWLFVAPFLADLMVRWLPLPIGTEILLVALSGAGFGGAATLLQSSRIGFNATLSSRRSLLWLFAFTLVSTAAVAVFHLVVLTTTGAIGPEDFAAAALRAFIGDLIGVMVVTPFLLILFTRRQFPKLSLEIAVLPALVLTALWIVFRFADAYRFQLFYLFFVPVVWIAIRFGLEGVTVGLMVTQIGLIAALQLSGQTAVDVLSYQSLMVVLATTGLAIGVIVSEQQRAQHQLRLQQEALNRASRLGTMGEFAAALAHEINQPLTAIANFTRLAKRAAESQPPNTAAAITAASSAIEQVDRAADVVRRLRDFIRLGRSTAAPVAVQTLISESLALCRPELERYGIGIEAQIARDLPSAMVDALQIEQVLMNLIRNSTEALTHAGRQDGKIIVKAESETDGRIAIRVLDNGPGLDPDLAGQTIAPFTTTKTDGLGLGLSLSRSIVEAHGGKLHIDSSSRGAEITFTLPCVRCSEQPS